MSREIDALIAEHVMGLDASVYPIRNGTVYSDGKTTFRIDEGLPHYSTSIKDAWEVIEKVKHDGTFSLDWYEDEGWNVVQYIGNEIDTTIADTASLAICKAALKAKGVKYDNNR